MLSRKLLTGSANPLGATAGPHGTNFAVSSGGDEVTLCLSTVTAPKHNWCCPIVTVMSGMVRARSRAGQAPVSASADRLTRHRVCARPASSARPLRALLGAGAVWAEVLGHAVDDPWRLANSTCSMCST